MSDPDPPTPAAPDVARGGRPPRVAWRSALIVLVALLTGTASAVVGTTVRRFVDDIPRPMVAAVDLPTAFFDTRPIEITTTVSWVTIHEVIEVERLSFDHTLWRRMFFPDWDRLAGPLRGPGVAAMLNHYADLIATRTAGARMTAADWDWVPQPVRAMAFVNMIEHWFVVDRPGHRFDIDPELLLKTIKAICMTESWFEHRAVNRNADGSTDIGLAQASDYARAVTQRWTEAGLWSLPMRENDYFNPWLATRWLVAWFSLMIDEAGGDLDLAVRAYNVGRPRARTAGEAYLQVVLARRARYFDGPSGSPTWQQLSAFRRDILAGSRPSPAPQLDTVRSSP